jgi:hypothetical protein
MDDVVTGRPWESRTSAAAFAEFATAAEVSPAVSRPAVRTARERACGMEILRQMCGHLTEAGPATRSQ